MKTNKRKIKAGDFIKIKSEFLVGTIKDYFNESASIDMTVAALAVRKRKLEQRAWDAIRETIPEIENWNCSFKHKEGGIFFEHEHGDVMKKILKEDYQKKK